MDKNQIPSLSKEQKRIFLESVRYHVLIPLDAIIGYSEILDEEFSYEHIAQIQDRDESKQCARAIKNILINALNLQKKVDLFFSNALIEQHNKNFDMAIYLASLQHAILTPVYAIIGNYELLLEHGITNYGMQIEQDAQKIHKAAHLFIRSVNKITAKKATRSLLPSLLAQLGKNIQGALQSSHKKIPLHQTSPTVAGKVLIIDDNTLILNLWQRQIEFFGYKAIAAETWEKATKILEKSNIDLILLQIVMTKSDGFEILRKFKRHQSTKDLPLIAIGPLKRADIAKKCFELGAIDYLTQPLQQLIFKTRVNDCIEKKKLIDKENEYITNIQEHKFSIENSLLESLPQAIVGRLEQDKSFVAERSEEASVLFADIVGFSHIVDQLAPQQTVRMLNIIFSAFDAIMNTHKVEKIKTIGDNYMAIAGLPIPNHNHAESIAHAALEMMAVMQNIAKKLNMPIHLRIGINTGPVVAGIIGSTKIIYDAWGKTVNLASRIEAQGRAEKIQVSESTYDLLKNRFEFIYRGEVEVRSFGHIKLYYLVGPKKRYKAF